MRRTTNPQPPSRADQAAVLGITSLVAAALLLLLARYDLFLALVAGSVFAALTYLVWRWS